MDTRISEAAKAIHSLTSMTVSCYRDGQLFEYYSDYRIPEELPDFFFPYRHRLSELDSSIGCITSVHGFIFGFVRYADQFLVVGPFTEYRKSFTDLKEVADKLDPEFNFHENIIQILHTCPQMSFYSFIPILISTYRLLHFNEGNGVGNSLEFLTSTVNVSFYETETGDISAKNLSMEAMFEGIIEHGDVNALEEWFRINPLFHFRIYITGDELKDARDCFILCSSLYAKAAHRGGLDRGFTLNYQLNAIRAMEEMDNITDILRLQSDLALAYTREVAMFHDIAANTRLIRDAVRIIQRNLYTALRVDDIAEELSVSRGYLSKTFHDETGETISSFITQRKVAEAMRLLSYSRNSLSEISELLKFSSQSHFTRVFKKQTGMTPKHFRDLGHRRRSEFFSENKFIID